MMPEDRGYDDGSEHDDDDDGLTTIYPNIYRKHAPGDRRAKERELVTKTHDPRGARHDGMMHPSPLMGLTGVEAGAGTVYGAQRSKPTLIDRLIDELDLHAKNLSAHADRLDRITTTLIGSFPVDMDEPNVPSDGSPAPKIEQAMSRLHRAQDQASRIIIALDALENL